MAQKYYAIRKGLKTGIFTTWPEAQSYIKGFSGAEYKSFSSKAEAEAYLFTPKQEAMDWTADDRIEAYVDGSFDKNQNRYSYGVVIVKNGKVLETFNKADNDDRFTGSYQIAGEVFGAIAAIRWALKEGYKAIQIRYDYMGIEKWAMGDWKANKPVSQTYIQEIKPLFDHITICFKKEKAHSGVEYNELADQLAKKALQQ